MEGRERVAISLLEPGILKGRAGRCIGTTKDLSGGSQYTTTKAPSELWGFILSWFFCEILLKIVILQHQVEFFLSTHVCTACVYTCVCMCVGTVSCWENSLVLPSTSLRQDPYSNIELSEWDSHLQACSGSCLHMEAEITGEVIYLSAFM